MNGKGQFMREIAEYELRPTIIDRVSDDLIFFGFPLPTCKGEDDAKWLIQIYVKDGTIERTGFPYGKREFVSKWTDRQTLIYKQGANFDDSIDYPVID